MLKLLNNYQLSIPFGFLDIGDLYFFEVLYI